jgi:site-specific recombinase XerD
MEHNITVLFHPRLGRKTQNNLAPIYLRITVNQRRFEHGINRLVDLSKWSVSTGRMKGSSAEAKTLNDFLDVLKHKVDMAEREMILDGKEITSRSFKDKWFGIDMKKQMVLEVFKQHNDEFALLVGKEYAPGTLERYKTSLSHTRKFIECKYKLPDIVVTKLNYGFIAGYALWLKTVRNCNHNSTMKYLANFKKIVLICLKNGWIIKDPFLGYKLTTQEVQRAMLIERELKQITSKQFYTDRLNYVRDIFVFSCYTGLAYADVKKLKRSEILVGIDGERWIFTRRQKTDTPTRIPLLPVASALIDKYQDNPQCLVNDRVLPVLSNQKMNAYLKEIADICGINKNLTFHIARHTFATTVTLSNGVPIETVSKMLGHTNLRTTQHYAKILDTKISEDMKNLRLKLSAEKPEFSD